MGQGEVCIHLFTHTHKYHMLFENSRDKVSEFEKRFRILLKDRAWTLVTETTVKGPELHPVIHRL